MGVEDFVRHGVGQMRVARPVEGRRNITCPYRLGAPPLFSQLEVQGDEAAVFHRHGAVLGVLGPGRHSLSPTTTPFLEPVKSSDQQRYECGVVFVSTQGTRVALDGSVGTLTDTSGRVVEFFLMGVVTVGASDAAAVVSRGIGVGEGGDGFDAIVQQRLMRGISERLSYLFEQGLAAPSDVRTIGPALLTTGRGDQLGVAVLGLEVRAVEVSRLVSSDNLPPAGREAVQRRAEVAAADALPSEVTCRFGAARIPFWDTQFEMMAHVSVVGHFEGDHVPANREAWLKNEITETLRQAAMTWTGTVLDLQAKKDDWARYVTQVVAPQLLHREKLRGRVVIDGVEISMQDHEELKRRRAAKLYGR